MEELIKQGAGLKAQIDTATARLREINMQIANAVDFGNQKSITITAAGYKVQITQRENIKWDHKKLDKFRSHVGDNDFFTLFKTEFKPNNKEIASSPMQKDIQFCRTVTPGAPSVVYKEVKNEL